MEAIIPTLATKTDLETLRTSLVQMQGDLRTDFERGQKENRAWMVATVIALFVGVLAIGNFIAGGLEKRLEASASARVPTALAPIVIQLPASALDAPRPQH